MKRASRLRIAGALLVGLGVAALPVFAVPLAEACGGFFRAKTIAPEERPSLAREKVLLIHDTKRGKQHFIREVAFERATEPSGQRAIHVSLRAEPFGFVVPTPTRPTVAKVDKTPFTRLRTSFPFTRPPPIGRGSGFGGRGPGVTVLEVEKVGSFTAFVLAATDARALSTWLEDNELVSSKEADAWLAHYVRMGFFYVAMRYDPPSAPAGPEAAPSKSLTAETIRISFDTPIPYYPYFEPEAPELGPEGPRLLELWYVGTQAVEPVALQEVEGTRQWVRPLRAGELYGDARLQLEAALEPEIESLLPEGELLLQVFQDQKVSRSGFQDVLFASKQARTLTPEQVAALEPLLGILDPALIPEAN